MSTLRYPGATNGFIPEATGQVIAFVRSPSKFKLNNYVQYVESPAPIGLYHVMDRDQPTRVVSDEEFAWEDGDPRPTGNHNLGRFRLEEFRCRRRDYPFTLGNQAIDTAKGWKPVAFQAAIVASQAMTNRTKRVLNMLQTSGNWGNNTAAANTLNGGAGNWTAASNDESDANYLAIKKSLLKAAQNILLATNGVVQLSDLRLVISPGLASIMSSTAEIHDYLKSSQYALPNLQFTATPNQNALWGLPPSYCGIEIVVEDATIVAERPSANGTEATTNRTFIKNDTTAILMSRVGGIDGEYGAPSFSTVQLYFYKYEMEVQTKNDTWNELTEGHVVEHYAELLPAPVSGYLITSCS